MALRVVVVSDTHNQHQKLEVSQVLERRLVSITGWVETNPFFSWYKWVWINTY